MDTDAELMYRVKYGDNGAFEELVRRHYASVLNVAYRYLGDPHAAEDLAQEAFLKVYAARRRYQVTARFTTWLFRIAVNACLNYRRRHRSTVALITTAGGQGLQQAVDSGSDPPGFNLERRELSAKLHQALQKLPPNQRAALVLNKLQGFSYAEVAEVMNSTVPAVKSLLSRARHKLKEMLQPYMST